jgi:hypothetical protein
VYANSAVLSPTLETERLLLQPFAPENEDALFEQWNEPSVRKYLFDDEPVPREVVRAQIEVSRTNEGAIGCGFRVIKRLGMQRFGDIVVGGRPTPYYRLTIARTS